MRDGLTDIELFLQDKLLTCSCVSIIRPLSIPLNFLLPAFLKVRSFHHYKRKHPYGFLYSGGLTVQMLFISVFSPEKLGLKCSKGCVCVCVVLSQDSVESFTVVWFTLRWILVEFGKLLWREMSVFKKKQKNTPFSYSATVSQFWMHCEFKRV